MSTSALAPFVRAARACVVLTGAGVSTASGIPDFRGDHGLWSAEEAGRVATIAGFHADPGGFYAFWRDKLRTISDARPNVAHVVLARLEARSLVRGIITQNVDGLHQAAGSRVVLEVHGRFARARCLTCGRRYETRAFVAGLREKELPHCEVCSGLVKPDVVLFGEPLDPDYERAVPLVRDCDLLLVLGTSLAVAPVSELVPSALAHGARVCIVNRDPTPFDEEAEVRLGGDLGAHMRALAEDLAISV